MIELVKPEKAELGLIIGSREYVHWLHINCATTVNRKRFAGLNFHSVHGFQEHSKSFP